MKGKVKWFNDTKGFGFIEAEDGAQVFVHFTGIQMPGRRTLNEGDAVQFDVQNSEKGPKAANVILVGV